MLRARTVLYAVIGVAAYAALIDAAHADEVSDKAAVKSLLSSYQAALNASSTEQVLPLYDEGGVFMQPYAPSAVGKAALREAYDADFKAFTLAVTFDPIEVVVTSPDWAFARTASAGTQTIHATGAKEAEANQELFVLHKQSGSWRIARYAFSTTNPQSQR